MKFRERTPLDLDGDPRLERPKISVKIPEVKLRLEDIGFLRSLATPNGIHCKVRANVIDRLRFLDLIAQAKVFPTGETVQQVEQERNNLKAQLLDAVEKQKWDLISHLGYELVANARKLEPTVKDILTKRGEQLLARGAVTVAVRKIGCVR